jgi:hypothetical protein
MDHGGVPVSNPDAMQSRVSSISMLRLLLACLHIGMAVVSFLRPNMIELLKGYSKFGEIGNTTSWGFAAAIIGAGLLLIPRGQILLILWQAASAIFFCLFCLLVTSGPSGLNWGSVVYGGLGFASAGIAFLTADDVFQRTQWPQRFRVWLGKDRGGKE